MGWEEFVERAPPGSVALDGIVADTTRIDLETGHFNFDHHVGAEPLATNSTCRQVYDAIRRGLVECLDRIAPGKPIRLWVNHGDQDIGLSAWLMRNHDPVAQEDGLKPLYNLVRIVNELDVYGGAQLHPWNRHLLQQQNWIFQPYNLLRKSGTVGDASAEQLHTIIDETCERIDLYMQGKAEETPLDTRYEVLHSSKYGYQIVRELGGCETRIYLFQNGTPALISVVGKRANGNNDYVVALKTPFVDIPLLDLRDKYNEIEGLPPNRGWGGSTLHIGSPRMNGSILSPEDLGNITDAYLKEMHERRAQK
jgi:hypothetical protein